MSCSDDSLNQGNAGDVDMLPIEDVDIHPLGDKFSIAYSSSVPWTMTIKEAGLSWPSWITASVRSGKAGTTVVNFTIDSNVEEDRSCTVQFVTEGGTTHERSFDISQEKAYLTVTESSFNFPWERSGGSGKSFEVKSNVDWTIELSNQDMFAVDYATTSTGYAAGSQNVRVSTKTNNFSTAECLSSLAIRPLRLNNKGELVEMDNTLQAQYISLIQDYLLFLVTDSNNNLDLRSFSELGDDFVKRGQVSASEHLTKQRVIVTSEVSDWGYDLSKINTGAESWGLKLEKKSQYKSDALTQTYGRNITVTELDLTVANPNPGTTARTGSFDFYVNASNGEKETRTVTLHQDAYQMQSQCVGSTAFENVSGQAQLQIRTKGPWHIEESEVPSWLTVSPMSGVGNADITVKAERQNLEFSDNSTNLTVYSGINSLKQTNKFTQKKFVFEVSGSDQFSEPLSRMDVSERVIYVTSSGPWTLKCVPASSDDGTNWLNISVLKGSAGENIPVTITPKTKNPDKQNQRGKSITISSDLHENAGSWPTKAKSNFTFIQDKFRFELTKNGQDVASEHFTAYSKSANSSTIKMACSAPWRITGVPDWLNFSVMEGDGLTYPDIKITAANNVGTNWKNSRQANIVIKSDVNSDGSYSETKTLAISQDEFVFAVSPESSTYSVEVLNEQTYSVPVNVTAGVTWYIEPDSWIGLVGSATRTGSATVQFKPAQNGKLVKRTGYLRIRCDVLDNPQQTVLTINQDAYTFNSAELTLSEFSDLKASSASVAVVCTGPWTIEEKPQWLTISPMSGYGNATLSVVAANNSDAKRTGTFKIVSTVADTRHEKKVNVSQTEFLWQKISGFDNITAEILGVQSKTLKFKSSGDWTASSNNSFVTLGTTSGYGSRLFESSLSFQIQPNYTLSDRTAKVTIQSKDFSTKKLEVSVTQPKYVFDVKTPSATAFKAAGGSITVEANCTGSLAVDCGGASWLTAKVSGNSIVLTALSNSSSKRTAKVTIRSEHYSQNSALSKEIEFTQDGK